MDIENFIMVALRDIFKMEFLENGAMVIVS